MIPVPKHLFRVKVAELPLQCVKSRQANLWYWLPHSQHTAKRWIYLFLITSLPFLQRVRSPQTCDVREDITYYNESEPNPEKLRAAKLEGEAKRDKNDLFFLGIAIALRDKKISMDQARAILSDALPTLDFATLEDVRFVGDGSYLKFHDMCVEVRKSGTDAKTKSLRLWW